MKKLLLIAGFLLAIAPGVQAQDVKPLGHVKDEVGMSKEQYAAYKKIREDNKQAVAVLEADSAVDIKIRKAKKKELNTQRDAAILNLLDDTQKIKYQAYEERKKAQKDADKKAKSEAADKPTEE